MGKVIIECSDKAALECIIPLLQYMKEIGEEGHSFPIDVDQSDQHNVFHFDGDGSHSIGGIQWESV